MFICVMGRAKAKEKCSTAILEKTALIFIHLASATRQTSKKQTILFLCPMNFVTHKYHPRQSETEREKNPISRGRTAEMTK